VLSAAHRYGFDVRLGRFRHATPEEAIESCAVGGGVGNASGWTKEDDTTLVAEVCSFACLFVVCLFVLALLASSNSITNHQRAVIHANSVPR
jgi:hypothetical protein